MSIINDFTIFMKKAIIATSAAIILAAVLLVSCAGSGSLVFSDAEKVGTFPEQHDLKIDESEIVEIDAPGMTSVISSGPILMALSSMSDPAVALFDYETLEPRGKYLRHGNGPTELLPFTGPSRSNTLFRHSGDSLYMDILGVNKNLLRWNVSAAFSDGREEIEAVPAFKDLKSIPFKWMLNDSTVLCKKLEDNSRRQVRELYVSGKLQATPNVKELDDVSIVTPNDGFLFNVLTTIPAYNPEREMIAEASLFLNVINIYSLRSDFRKSIVFGKAASVREVEKEFKSTGVMRQSIWTCIPFGDYFIVLYGAEGTDERELLVFDWDGNSVCKYFLHEGVDAIDINLDCRTLLTFDSETETLRKYKL